MITQSESGKSTGDYTTLQSTDDAIAYRVTAHLWSPDFGGAAYHADSTVSSTAGTDFDAAVVAGVLVKVTHPGLVERFDGSTWSHLTIGSLPATLLPSLSLAVDGTDLYLYYMAKNHIYVIKSTDQGATWGSWQVAISYSDQGTQEFWDALKISAVGKGYVVWTFFDPTTKTHMINYSKPQTYPAITAGLNDLRLTCGIRSISAASMPTTDDPERVLITLATDTPGAVTAKYIDNQVVKYFFRAGGIISFWSQHDTMSDHAEIDTYDNVMNFIYRECVRLSTIGDTTFLVAASGDGTPEHPFISYRLYSTKDGRFWSNGFIIPDIIADSHSTLKLLVIGNYLYAVSRRDTWRSPCTLQFGNSTVSLDLTDRVDQYHAEIGPTSNASLLLNNEDGALNSMTYETVKHTWALVHEWGFDTNAGPVIQQVAIHEIDSWDKTQTIDNGGTAFMCQVTSRDHYAWMTDKFQSEQPHYWQSQMVGVDSYDDNTGTSYGGLTHTATQTGTFRTQNNTLLLTANDEEGVAFSTFSQGTMWNGSVSVGARAAKVADKEYFGLAFRAIDQDNMWYFCYTQDTDRLHLFERRGGLDDPWETSSPMGWASDITSFHFLRVDFRYANVKCYTSTDGITWTLMFDHTCYGAKRIVGVDYAKIETRPFEKGYVGVIGKGFSSLDNWNPDPGNIDIPQWLNDFGQPETDVVPATDLIPDTYQVIGVWIMQRDGTTQKWSKAGGLLSDITSADSVLLTRAGNMVKMVSDYSNGNRFVALGSKAIIAIDDKTSGTASSEWYTAYIAPANVTFLADIRQDPHFTGRFFWIGQELDLTLTTAKTYVYYTYDNFKTVNRTQVFIHTPIGGVGGLAISSFNTAGNGYVWVSSGRNTDINEAGVWLSKDWGKTFKRVLGGYPYPFTYLGGGTNTIVTPGVWGAINIPFSLPGGGKNVNNEHLYAAWQGLNGSSSWTGYNDGNDAFAYEHVTLGGFTPPITYPAGAQGSNSYTLDGSYVYAITLRDDGHTAYGNYGGGTGSGSLDGVSSDYDLGLNGWPSNKDWLVAYGAAGARIFINASSAGATPDWAIGAVNVITAFGDPAEQQDFPATDYTWDVWPSIPNDTIDDGWNNLDGTPLDFSAPELCLNFIENYVYDRALPQTVEDSFRCYANFAGIHDFKFLKTIEGATSDPSLDWDAQGTMGKSGNTITFSPSSTGNWYGSLNKTEVPHSYLVRGYMPNVWGRGFIVNARANDSTAWTLPHYWVGTDSTGHPIMLKYDAVGGVYNVIQHSPDVAPASGVVKLAVRELGFTASNNSLWLSVSLWINDRLYFTFIEWLKAVPETPYYMGLAAYSGDCSVTDLEVPQLTDFVEWNSLDMEETPDSGLQRAMDGRYVLSAVRWDGSLHAWRAAKTTVKQVFLTEDIEGFDRTLDRRQLITHLRMVGAYKQSEFIRRDLGEHRFSSQQNPYLMSERECYYEAQRAIWRSEELYDTVQFSIAYRPLLEASDRITVGDWGDYIVNGISVTLAAPDGTATFACRKYIYGA